MDVVKLYKIVNYSRLEIIMKYNIFCDESRHMQNGLDPVMVLGAVLCLNSEENHINNLIRGIKEKHKLNPNIELKWTKVSHSKLAMYKEIIDLIKDQKLFLRVLIADKTKLNHEAFHQNHDDWYYKMYYYLLSYFGAILDTDYKVFFDIKDTHSSTKISKLSEILENKYYQSKYQVKAVRSEEKQLIQIIDLIIGAAGYKYSGYNTSSSKLELIDYIEKKLNVNLDSITPFNSHKINIFVWQGK